MKKYYKLMCKGVKRSKKIEAQLNQKAQLFDETLDKLDIAVEDQVMKTKRLSTLEYFTSNAWTFGPVIMKNSITEYKYYIMGYAHKEPVGSGSWSKKIY